MKKTILLPTICFLINFTCLNAGAQNGSSQTPKNTETTKKEQGYVITGRIAGIDSGIAVVYNPHIKKLDKRILQQGQFEFIGHADTPQYLAFSIYTKGRKVLQLYFFAENRRMNISGDINDADNVLITGSTTQDDYKMFCRQFESSLHFKPFGDEEERLGELHDSLQAKGDQKGADSAKKVLESFLKTEQAFVKRYVKQHASSYVSAFEVDMCFDANPDAAELETIYNEFTPGVQNSYYGKKVKGLIEGANRTTIGKIAPDFTQNDPNGNPIKLSSYRGRYLLLEFWASWCGPCRVENPGIVAVYSKYHPKGLEILGVSMDEKRDKWLEAIKKDNLGWTQVSDLKHWNNNVRELYGVEGIPMNFLIDKEGKIIARDLTGGDLTKKLDELFK
jgi:peroxiredoxin